MVRGRNPRAWSWTVRLIAGFCVIDAVFGIATFIAAFTVMNDFRHEALANNTIEPAFLAALAGAQPATLLVLGAILLAALLGIGAGLVLLVKRRRRGSIAAVSNERIVRTLTHPDGARRVPIVQRPDGLYGYEIEEFRREEVEFRREPIEYWLPVSRPPIGIFDSAATAEREARSNVAWLKDVPSTP